MNNTAELKRLVTGKDQIQAFADGVINEVKEGAQNPLEVKILITALKKSLEIIEDGIKDSVLSEATKHGKNFEFKGARVTIKENGTKYDYSGCCYHNWMHYDSQEKNAKSHKQEAEAFLKGLKEPITVVDELTGEVVKVYPPIKTSSTGLSISF